MALTTYTSYAEVRAVLGVSSTELPDTTLALPMYGLLATLALEDIHVDLPTSFSTVSALPSKTTNEQRFVDLVQLYVPYTIAKNLLTSLPMFGVKQLSDGRAEFQRQADVFDDVRDGVDAALSSLRYRLAAVFSVLNPTLDVSLTIPTVATVVATGLNLDPVTGA